MAVDVGPITSLSELKAAIEGLKRYEHIDQPIMAQYVDADDLAAVLARVEEPDLNANALRFSEPSEIGQAPTCERHGTMVADDEFGRSWHCAVCNATWPAALRDGPDTKEFAEIEVIVNGQPVMVKAGTVRDVISQAVQLSGQIGAPIAQWQLRTTEGDIIPHDMTDGTDYELTPGRRLWLNLGLPPTAASAPAVAIGSAGLREEPDGWQPISSAPVEGKFLVWDGRRMAVMDGHIYSLSILPETPHHLSGHHWTRWQPLPAPPAALRDGPDPKENHD